MTDKIRKNAGNQKDSNRDPISGAPGAHPLGTGAGAASAGVAGAVAGMAVGGPVGSVVGAAVGSIAGGLAGKGLAEAANPTVEEEYWKESYDQEPYYMEGKSYEYYAPGFRAGWEGRVRHDGRSFDDAESDLTADYNETRNEMDPDWDDIKPAARAAWNRVEQNRNSSM
jgi:hypothetical protein